MKQLTIGILAHVDAGKTTLSEAILAAVGRIAKPGRVDNRDAYLDTYALEKARGITIFAKQAVFDHAGIRFTLLDTPGHVDFSAEMERTLQVLDCAILVVSGPSGVQGHTRTLWRLFERYGIPVFLFVNKMDQPGTDRDRLLDDLRRQLGDGCVPFAEFAGVRAPERRTSDDARLRGVHPGASTPSPALLEQLAVCDEPLLESLLETGGIGDDLIRRAIRARRVFPCFFGSALRQEGVDAFLEGFARFVTIPEWPEAFGARIFKISRDEQGNRLTHLKLTGGALKVRQPLTNGVWEEKVSQIRIYSGVKYEAPAEIGAGTVCAVTGLTKTRPGDGLGIEGEAEAPFLEPVLTYRLLFPDGSDPRLMLPKLRLLEEEEPELHLSWDEARQEIHALLMGEVQMEILQSLVRERCGVDIGFDAGHIVYRETIADTVEGVGHFEPLRHYAEVHLVLEPGAPGSGLAFGSDCSEDELGRNWQRLILTHLGERDHVGTLTGSEITDMRITLVSGRAHNKHTQGGDFREATCRAVRQGLMEAESILLEPWYDFTLSVPDKMVGRAMIEVEQMHGHCEVAGSDGEMTELSGRAPVATMKNWQKEVSAWTKGFGRLFCRVRGYEPCHNAEEVIAAIGYDPARDLAHPTGSVFCAQGTGYPVEWDEVKAHMHLPSIFDEPEEDASAGAGGFGGGRPTAETERFISIEEVDSILNRTSQANVGRKAAWKSAWKSRRAERSLPAGPVTPTFRKKVTDEEYLLVDGYNIIFAWQELKELAEKNLDAARIKLLDILCNYQGIRKCHVIAVFDAYRVPGRREEISDYHNIHEVFTKEAQTADQYIERFAHVNRDRYRITVATSDGLQQMIVRSAGSALLSARELKLVVDEANERMQRQLAEQRTPAVNPLRETLSPEELARMKEISEGRSDA